MFPEIFEAELSEQTAGVKNMVLSGPPAVESLPAFTTGACAGFFALTERSIVTNPRKAEAREIVKPDDGTDTPPIWASTNVGVSTGIEMVAFHVNVAAERSRVPAKSNFKEQVPLAKPET